jgi:hypothetical protein
VKGSAERGPGGQAESPASRVVPLDGPVILILSSNANSPVWRTFRRDIWGSKTARPRRPNPFRDEVFLLRVPAKHLDGHGLARHECSRRSRHAVGRNEDAAVSNIEANPSDASDRDEAVLVGHRVSDVRTIRALASDKYFAVGAASCGSPARSLRGDLVSVDGAPSFKGNPPLSADRRCASSRPSPRADPVPERGGDLFQQRGASPSRRRYAPLRMPFIR